MSKRVYKILILISAVLALCGCVLWGVSASSRELTKNTVIRLNGESSTTLHAELTGFYPGSGQEFAISLTGDGAAQYYITLDFRDRKGGELEDYLTVVIRTATLELERNLKDLLDGEAVSLGQGASEIEIFYFMPEETGNEAQGTRAVFEVELTARRMEL